MHFEDIIRDIALYFDREISFENDQVRKCRMTIPLSFQEPSFDSILEAVVAPVSATYVVEAGFAWLEDHRPDDDREPVLNWGDARLGNAPARHSVLSARNRHRRVAADGDGLAGAGEQARGDRGGVPGPVRSPREAEAVGIMRAQRQIALSDGAASREHHHVLREALVDGA